MKGTKVRIRLIKNKLRENISIVAMIFISIFFPIGGVFLIIALVSKWNLFKSKDYSLDIDSDFQEIKYYFMPDIDIKEDSNTIALEDSLEISDFKFRRKTVLDILKKDIDKYDDFMKSAIKNDDSETTHYVASRILYNKRELDYKIKQIRVMYSQNNLDKDIALNYYEILIKQLNLPYVEKQLKFTYTSECISVLKNIIDNKLDLLPKYIISLIDLLIQSKQTSTANYYYSFLEDNYPNSEEKYLCLLKNYYNTGNYIRFQHTLIKMNQEVFLSKDTSNLVNFWLGGFSENKK